MRYNEFKTLIFEGGNIWKADTGRINRADVIPTVKFLEKITGLALVNNLLGTTGLKDSSGDIDMAVDEKQISKADLANKLKSWTIANPEYGTDVKKTGISVHFKTPINGDPKNGYVQSDFMMLADPEFSKWVMSGDKSSNYRNRIRMIIMASLARYINLRWSYIAGLIDNEYNPIPNGRNAEFIAKILLGSEATAKNISTTENILSYLDNDPNKEAKLAQAKETLKTQDGIILP